MGMREQIVKALLGVKAATGGKADPLMTGWTFRDVAHPNRYMGRGDWRAVTNATNTGEGILNTELPIRSMYATQPKVNPDFAAPAGMPHEAAPFVIKKGDKYFVQDGHHRLVAASEAGQQTAPVRLVDLDKTTQTDFPLVDLMKKYGLVGGLIPTLGAFTAQDTYEARP